MSAPEIALSELLRAAGVHPVSLAGPDSPIRAVRLDSREIEPGDLFCALAGQALDGEHFVPDAVGRGARAVLAASPPPPGLAEGIAWVQVAEPRRATGLLARERAGRPDEAMALVGVTGTNGKTTVAWMMASIGRAAGCKTGQIGTLGWSYDGTSGPPGLTTPEAPALFGLLDDMRRDGVEIVAMEVSSHALAMHRVAGARFAAGAFLNLGRDHQDFHGDQRAYFEAKATLFERLEADRVAVLPAESPWIEELRRRTRARVVTFGRTTAADVRLCEERCGLRGSSAILKTPDGKLPVRTFLLGRVNLDNAAAAAACALALGLPPQAVTSGILALEAVPGRMEPVDRGQPFTVLVDFAHTPHALEALLGWLRSVTTGRLWVVFGCGGNRDRGKRAAMGRIAARLADEIVVTSDNPRAEEPAAIAGEVVRGIAGEGAGATHHVVELDRARAIELALGAAAPGDLVVIAGKGAETTQIIGERRLSFDDRDVATQALARCGHTGGRRAGA